MELDEDMYDDARSSLPVAGSNGGGGRPTSAVRDNALHLRGVDELSTAQVLKYVTYCTRQPPAFLASSAPAGADVDASDGVVKDEDDGGDVRLSDLPVQASDTAAAEASESAERRPMTARPRVEWIDDTCLNLVYYTPEEARDALERLLAPGVSNERIEIDCLHGVSVPARAMPASVLNNAGDDDAEADATQQQQEQQQLNTRLAVRYATSADKKEAGAKDRSRYYLFHPESDPDTKFRNGGGRGGGRGGSRGGRRAEPYANDARHKRRRLDDRDDSGRGGVGEDLFADKLKARDEALDARLDSGEDLFAGRMKKGVGRMAEPGAGATSSLAARMGPAPLASRLGANGGATQSGDTPRTAGGPVRRRPRASDHF